MKYKITSPISVILPRVRTKDRVMPLNMNNYGNTNTFTNDETKKKYKEIMKSTLQEIYIDKPVEIYYKVFKQSRKLDKMNVVAVVSKYLMDALVELHCIEDDNDDFIKTEYILPTEVDKNFPRCEVTIIEIE